MHSLFLGVNKYTINRLASVLYLSGKEPLSTAASGRSQLLRIFSNLYQTPLMLSNDVLIQAILDNTPESIVLISKEHKVLAFNKAIRDVLIALFNRVVQVGDDYHQYVAEGSKELYAESFDRAMKGERIKTQHLAVTENASFWSEYTMNPVYGDDNELIGVAMTAKNIDAEKRAELKLQSLTNKLNSIIENTEEAITLLDTSYRVLLLNNVAKTLIQDRYNIVPERGTDFRQFIPQTDSDFYIGFEKALNHKSSESEIWYSGTDGSKHCYHSTFNPVYNENKELIGVSVFATDVTEKKLIEKQFKDREKLFRRTILKVPVGIIITDKNLKINLANFAAQKCFGYKRDEIVHLYLPQIITDFKNHEDHQFTIDDFTMSLDKLLFDNENLHGVSATGKNLELLVSMNSFTSDGTEYFIFLINDLTEKLNDEKTIIQNQKVLRDIAWHQSHVIRAPLSRVLGIMNLLTDKEMCSSKEEQDTYFDFLITSVKELDEVINAIVQKTNQEA
jgi:two-component system, sporulation sensor kinase E